MPRHFSVFEDQQHADYAYPALGPAFLDCGAYSVLTGFWQELPVPAYVEFVVAYQDSFARIAAPDVIGDAKATFANLKQWVDMLKERGAWDGIKQRVVVTYHLTDRDPDTMVEMLKWSWAEGIEWLAVGGIVTPGLSPEQRYAMLQFVHELLHKEVRLPFKVHLFGGYYPEFIRYFKPDSVDSATYIAAARVLSLVGYKGWEMFKLKAPRGNDTLQVAFLLNYMEEHTPWVFEHSTRKELEPVFRKLPDAIRFWFANMAGLTQFERFVSDASGKPDFRYWISIHLSMPTNVMRRSPVTRELFWKAWQDRCLVAFPTFYERGVFVYTKELQNLFRSANV